MTTKNMAYDSPNGQVHFTLSAGEAGGGAATQYAKFAAWTAMQLYAVQATVTTAGTAGISTWAFLKINTGGTSTTALFTLQTGTVGAGFNCLLTTASGGLALAAGDIGAIVSGGDATAKVAVSFEGSLTPTSGAVTV